MMGEVPKHRKRGGKKLRSSLSIKHLWDLVDASFDSLLLDASRASYRYEEIHAWSPNDWRWWAAPRWCDGVSKHCDTLDLLVAEIESRM